ncbi:MAG: hypothetical protein ACAH88_13610 [Roseimicrobium sp.]
MLKRLLRPLLEPIAAKLDKLLDRTSEGFKKQQERQSDAKDKLSERLNMLSRQIDESRDEVIRGFARQDAKMKKQLDEVMLRLAKLGALSGSRPGAVASAAPGLSDAAGGSQGMQGDNDTPSTTPSPNDSAPNPLAEMMLDAGGAWLASQEEEKRE